MANVYDALDQAPTSNPYDAMDATHPTSGPSGNYLNDADNIATTIGANVLGGILSMPRAATKGIDWLGSLVPQKIGGPLGGLDQYVGSIPTPGDPNTPLLPDYKQARDMAFKTQEGPDWASKKPATEYIPSSYLGRRAMDAATSGALGILSGGAAAALPSTVGGATAGAAAEAFPEHPFLAGVAGFIPGAKIGGMLQSAPQRVYQAATGGAMNEPYGAFSRLGLPSDLSGTVTGNKSLKGVEKLAEKIPGAGETMAARKADLLSAWQDKYNAIADDLGGPGTPAELGQALQKHSQDWLDSFRADKQRAWDNFDTLMPPDTHIDVTNFRDQLDKNLSRFPDAPATGGVLQAGTMKSLKDALEADLNGGKTLPFGTVQNIRSAVGERLDNPQLISDTSRGAWANLYRGLSGDLSAGAGQASPEALAAFKNATDLTKRGHDALENYISPILNADSPEKAGAWAMQGARLGADRLGGIIDALPDQAAHDLQAYAFRNLAGDPGIPSPSKFITNMTRPTMLSQEVRDTLLPQKNSVGPGVDLHGQNMDDLLTTAKVLKRIEKDVATGDVPHSASVPALFNIIEGWRAGHDIAGIPGAIGGAGIGLMAPSLFGKVVGAPLGPRSSSLFGRDIPFSPSTTPSDLWPKVLNKVPGAKTGVRALLGASLPSSND